MSDAIENGEENKLASTYSPVIQVKFLMDLAGGKIEIYNEHTNKTIRVATIKKSGMKLNDMLLLFEATKIRGLLFLRR